METAKTLNKNSERNMGIEFLRIVAMFMIVVHHLLFHGGILDNVCPNTANYYIVNILEVICLVCVNLYALITGYVCVYSKMQYKRIINLWFEVALCSGIWCLIFFILPDYGISKIELVFSFLPVMSKAYWYFTCYFCLFFIIPIINVAIKTLSVNKIRIIIVVVFMLFCISPELSYKYTGCLNLFGIADGYSVIWLAYMYLCGAYIRKFMNNDHKILKYLIIYLVMLIVHIVFKIYFNSGNIVFELHYNSPLIFLESVFLFICFKSLRVTYGKNIISVISSVSFFVYLISDNDYFRNYIEKGSMVSLADENSIIMVAKVLIIAIGIYSVSTIIGLFIKQLLKVCRIYDLSEIILLLAKWSYSKFLKFIYFLGVY